VHFLDETSIIVRSGAGGKGHVSFRREKFVPDGGPNGGDGGHGGAVVFQATASRNTLVDYHRRRHWFAEDGEPGGRNQMSGAGGADRRCLVPLGTLLFDDATGDLLADLDHEGAAWTLPGGRGGLGNQHFATPTNQAPRKAQPGEPGVEMVVRLELKLLADVGLLGFPNAGKSTFLGRVSAARPKVADYPFTTLVPQLGVVRVGEEDSFVLADIPGLVEGAAEGAGLGHRFLKHLERCGGYLHLVSADPNEDLDPVARWRKLNGELRAYDEAWGSDLFQRPQIVVLNKADLLDAEALESVVGKLRKASRSRVLPISARNGEGVAAAVAAAWELLRSRRAHAVSPA
jgi:GTP-binding protein